MQVSSGGVGLTTVLTIVFVVLKLVGVIHWSWAWVLAPLWIGGSIGLAALLIIAIVIFATAGKHRRNI